MRALQPYMEPLLLHHLPHDVLVAILQRAPADDIDRVAAVPCRAVCGAARADILWGPAVRCCFGASLAARVAASLEGEPAEGEGEGVPERVPGWLSETVRLSWAMQQALIASYRAWHAQPTMRTAYRILARLVPPSFASDPQAGVQKLTSGEPREEDKARVLAFFVQLNARRWARARDSAADDVDEHRRVTSVLAHYLTTPKGAEGSSLARATCRAYTHSFDLAGLDLVAAIRLFMHETQMPKEARRMCHLFWSFAGAYYEQNGGYVCIGMCRHSRCFRSMTTLQPLARGPRFSGGARVTGGARESPPPSRACLPSSCLEFLSYLVILFGVLSFR